MSSDTVIKTYVQRVPLNVEEIRTMNSPRDHALQMLRKAFVGKTLPDGTCLRVIRVTILEQPSVATYEGNGNMVMTVSYEAELLVPPADGTVLRTCFASITVPQVGTFLNYGTDSKKAQQVFIESLPPNMPPLMPSQLVSCRVLGTKVDKFQDDGPNILAEIGMFPNNTFWDQTKLFDSNDKSPDTLSFSWDDMEFSKFPPTLLKELNGSDSHLIMMNNIEKYANTNMWVPWGNILERYEMVIGDRFSNQALPGLRFIKNKAGFAVPRNIGAPVWDVPYKLTSRAACKLIEILINFHVRGTPLVDMEDKTRSFRVAALGEGPGSFLEATSLYINQARYGGFCEGEEVIDTEKVKGKKKGMPFHDTDKIYAITLVEGDEGRVPRLKQEAKENLEQFNAEVVISNGGGNGDLTDPKIVRNFAREVGEKVDLVTGDAAFDSKFENFQEQQHAQLLFGEMIAMLSVLKEGGSGIIKLHHSYSTSAQICIVVGKFFSNAYISKPLTSRYRAGERFFVGEGFLGISKPVFTELYAIMQKWKELDPSGGYDAKTFLQGFPNVVEENEQQVQDIADLNTYLQEMQSSSLKGVYDILDLVLASGGKQVPPQIAQYISTIHRAQIEEAIDWCQTLALPINPAYDEFMQTNDLPPPDSMDALD